MAEATLERIPLALLDDHPDNPRLYYHEDVIAAIVANLDGEYPQRHAIEVRQVGDRYQILNGHHRKRAAEKAGLADVWAFVEDLDDDEAYMRLAVSNSQGEFDPLELGRHLYRMGAGKPGKGYGDLSKYAKRVGRKQPYMTQLRLAAEVAESYWSTNNSGENFAGKAMHLFQIHAAPEELWPLLVQKLVLDLKKNMHDVRASVQKINQFDIPEEHREWLPLSEAVERYLETKATPDALVKSAKSLLDTAHSVGKYAQTLKWLCQERPRAVLPIVAKQKELLEKELELKIIVGDCVQVLEGLAGKDFDLLIADPPYNVKSVEWDQFDSPAEYLDFTAQWVQQAIKCMSGDWHGFLFCSPSHMASIERFLEEKLGLRIRSRIVWHHKNLSMGRQISGALINSWEPIFHFGSGSPLHLPSSWGPERFDVQEFAVPQTNFTDEKVHHTQKPLELIRWLVEIGSPPGGHVLDPFAGGGTVAVACKGLSRDCTSIEKSEDFAAVAEERIRNA